MNPPAEGPSEQQIGDCSRRIHESCGSRTVVRVYQCQIMKKPVNAFVRSVERGEDAYPVDFSCRKSTVWVARTRSSTVVPA